MDYKTLYEAELTKNKKLKEKNEAVSKVNMFLSIQWKELKTNQNLAEMSGLGMDIGTDIAIVNIADEFVKLKEEVSSLNETILARDEEIGDIKENVFPGYDDDIKELKGRIEDAEHEASEWEDSYNELKEENKILKDKSKGFKTLFREVKKLRSSDKYLYKLLREEADSHGKTLNNMFEAFNLSEQNRKQARLHAESFTNAKSLEGHYRTLIGEWYIMCFKAQNKKLRKELEQKN